MKPKTGTCKICGKEITSKSHRSHDEVKNQRTCGSAKCVSAWRRQMGNDAREKWLASHVRHCPCCGEQLEQKKGERFFAFKTRVTCGRLSCRHKYATAKRMGTVNNLKPEIESIYENEADAIQAQINIDCAKHMAARSGMRFDAGRKLSKAEIAALVKSGGITPIERINDRIVGAYYVA